MATSNIVDWSKYTVKQRNAILHYMRTDNKRAAYSFAYPSKQRGMATLHTRAHQFFKRPEIADAVDALRAETCRRMNAEVEKLIGSKINEELSSEIESKIAESKVIIDAAWVLKRAALIADFNIRSFISQDEEGNAVYDFSDATDDDWYCIQEYVVEEIQRGQGDDRYFVDKLKVRSMDKLRALELVGKHIEVRAFSDIKEITGALLTSEVTNEQFKKARKEMLGDDDC